MGMQNYTWQNISGQTQIFTKLGWKVNLTLSLALIHVWSSNTSFGNAIQACVVIGIFYMEVVNEKQFDV
jgi:hypothetical protein